MPKSADFLLQNRRMLEAEYRYEQETFKRETTAMPIGRKIKRGICWFPLRVGRSYYNSLNQLSIEVYRTEDTDIDHNFEYGRPVCFFTLDANDNPHFMKFSAVVSYADGDRMVVIVPGTDAVVAIENAERLGVQLFFDETTYHLMFRALDAAIAAKDNRLAELREIFHGSQKPAKTTPFPTPVPWLNVSQRQAVNEVLRAKDVAIVHGPPGTGKTTTLVEGVYEILRRESQVMVCAQSNMAVDWISEKLTDRGVNVLRIGNPTRVNDKMLSFTYERRFESHPDYPQLWAVRRAIRQLYSQKGDVERKHQKISRLRDKATELELSIHSSLMDAARVVACTLAGAANRVLDGMKFHTLVVDEAAQALEAAVWIPLQKCHRVILAGDHRQLPPTIKSGTAVKGGLGKTLMETLAEEKPECVSLLNVQYRMNEAIARFSSEMFYEGRLESAPEVKNRGILDFDTPVSWIDSTDVDSKEEFVGDSYGRINRAEAKLTLETLKNYISDIGKERLLDENIDIGVISPYKAQVQLLRRMFGRDVFLRPFRNNITVNTVDGFQGQERDIIVISLVRANDEGSIGFLSDIRRMNVAITRARMKLFILGNAETLKKHKFYRRLYEYVSLLNNKE